MQRAEDGDHRRAAGKNFQKIAVAHAGRKAGCYYTPMKMVELVHCILDFLYSTSFFVGHACCDKFTGGTTGSHLSQQA